MPIPSPELLAQKDKTAREKAGIAAQEFIDEARRKEKTRKEVAGAINMETDPLDRYRSEVTRGAIKVMEQKTGQSLEFGDQEYVAMQQYVQERYAMLMTSRAEEYIRDHQDEVKARGGDHEAKGVAALDAVERLGATKNIVEGDEELKKVYAAFVALKEFSRGDIPPSARFAVMEQLNTLQDLQKDNDELRKTRVEVFKKWSGREPTINEAALNTRAGITLRAEVKNYLKELVNNLIPEEITFCAASGRPKEDFAILKDMGYMPFAKLGIPFWSADQYGIKKDGKQVNPDMLQVRKDWEKKVKEEKGEAIKGKIKLEMDGAFVAGVTNKTPDELDVIYQNLEADIYTEFDRKILAGTQEGKETMKQGEEAIKEKGNIAEFMRLAGTQFEGLTHNLAADKAGIIDNFRDKWGVDIDADTFTRFQESSGIDYNTFAKKRSGSLFYMLKLLAFAFQEIKVSATI